MAQGKPYAVHCSHSIWGLPRQSVCDKRTGFETGISSEELGKDELIMHIDILGNGISVDDCVQVWAPLGNKQR